MSNKDDLFEVWNSACEYYSIPEDVINHWFQNIRNKLSETVAETGCKRIYYNWCDMLVPKCNELKSCPAHVVLAAFFQYYEYDLNKCCVKENCEIFNQFYKDSKISNEVMRATICYLLGDQESERVACTIDEDMALLQDLDLLILAATEDVYKHYAELSRQEWQAAGHHNYNDLRRKVFFQNFITIFNQDTLNSLLELDIYQTTQFNNKYAKIARKNIENELAEL